MTEDTRNITQRETEDGKRGWAVPRILLAVAAISIAALWPGPSVVRAQPLSARPAAPPAPAAEEDSGPGNFAAPDRKILQALSRAQKVLKEHRYGEALEGLSQILRSGEDYFYQPDRKVPIYKSLKTEAQQLLGANAARGSGPL